MISAIIAALGDTYSFLIFVYIIMSWIPTNEGIIGDIRRALATLCDPYLNIFKKFIPPVGMIDFSPIVALLVLQLAVRFLVGLF